MSGGTRRSVLTRIMEIETQVKNMVLDDKFNRVKDNIRILKDTSFFGDIRVHNPNNIDSMIEVRRNSVKSRQCLEIYEKMAHEYEERINNLNNEKKKLQTELFR
ncbi:MAG: hypothetical protein H8D23_18940 [Candidatus Brocadiales bacterium]|nr:hypothetical protein [Candidatus Brocadiales bacterium]